MRSMTEVFYVVISWSMSRNKRIQNSKAVISIGFLKHQSQDGLNNQNDVNSISAFELLKLQGCFKFSTSTSNPESHMRWTNKTYQKPCPLFTRDQVDTTSNSRVPTVVFTDREFRSETSWVLVVKCRCVCTGSDKKNETPPRFFIISPQL